MNETSPLQLLVLVNSSWQLFKSKWLALLKVQLMGYLAIIGAAIVLGAVTLFLTAVASSSHIVIVGIIALAVIIGVAGLLLMASWIQLAQIYVVADAQQDSLRSAWPGSKGMLWVTLLSGLATLGGLILLIIPGIMIWVWLSQSQFVYGIENIHGTAALGRSKQLVNGRWWKTFGLLLFPSVVMYAISTILTQVIGNTGLSNATTASAIVSTALGIASGLYIFCYSYQLFLGLQQGPQVDSAKA